MVTRIGPSHKIEAVPTPVHIDPEAITRREYRESVTLLRRPHLVLYYLLIILWQLVVKLITSHLLLLVVAAALVGGRMYLVDASFEEYLKYESIAETVLIWVGLGFLSSFGMGFGLHTFVLFLAPAIYHVACVQQNGGMMEVWKVVWWWSFAWGTGTAIGELPPYFAAKAARLAGKRIAAIEELEGFKREEENPSFFGQLQAKIIKQLDHFEFWHIMVFASVPNPLFDFAGIACGHLLKPFWVFFGATFVGKAVFKANLQTFFVISTAMWFDSVAQQLTYAANYFGFAVDFGEYLTSYKRSLNQKGPSINLSVFTEVFQKAETPGIKDIVVLVVILGFVVSMVQGAVQAHLAELDEEAIARKHAKKD